MPAKKRSKSRKKKSTRKFESPNETEALIAKRLAALYRRKVRDLNFYAKPWRMDRPLESLPVWQNFVEAARLVRHLETTSEKFIEAQFSETWKGKSGYPWPTQLHNDGACQRWSRWLIDNTDTTVQTREDRNRINGTPFKSEEMKLVRLGKSMQVAKKRVLKEVPSEFSKEFLEHMGVWKKVKKHWLEVHGEE